VRVVAGRHRLRDAGGMERPFLPLQCFVQWNHPCATGSADDLRAIQTVPALERSRDSTQLSVFGGLSLVGALGSWRRPDDTPGMARPPHARALERVAEVRRPIPAGGLWISSGRAGCWHRHRAAFPLDANIHRGSAPGDLPRVRAPIVAASSMSASIGPTSFPRWSGG